MTQEPLWALSQPLAGSSPRALWTGLKEAQFRVEPRYGFRLMVIAGTSLLLAPLAWLERWAYEDRIDAAQRVQDPIFILGHWRTGTTLLHNLMAQDGQWGFMSTFQSFMPHVAILGDRLLKPLFQKTLPSTRPMDDMAVDMDLPQEEEFALTNLQGSSLYSFLYYPKHFDRHLASQLTGWSPHRLDAYRRMVEKVSWLHAGKPLLLKNPPNTARIPELLSLYPKAKFIYLHRDPHELYLSMVRTLRGMMQLVQLHGIDQAHIERNALQLYPRLITAFLDYQPKIPAAHFCCLSYAQLKRDPLGALAFIYDRLQLPGFDRTHGAFAAYMDRLGDYRPATYQIDSGVRALVDQAWGPVQDRQEAWLHTLGQARMGG
jgi:hypothetical protein